MNKKSKNEEPDPRFADILIDEPTPAQHSLCSLRLRCGLHKERKNEQK